MHVFDQNLRSGRGISGHDSLFATTNHGDCYEIRNTRLDNLYLLFCDLSNGIILIFVKSELEIFHFSQDGNFHRKYLKNSQIFGYKTKISVANIHRLLH